MKRAIEAGRRAERTERTEEELYRSGAERGARRRRSRKSSGTSRKSSGTSRREVSVGRLGPNEGGRGKGRLWGQRREPEGGERKKRSPLSCPPFPNLVETRARAEQQPDPGGRPAPKPSTHLQRPAPRPPRAQRCSCARARC